MGEEEDDESTRGEVAGWRLEMAELLWERRHI